MKKILLVCLVTALSITVECRKTFPLDLVHEWNQVEVKFPNDTIRQQLIDAGEYIPKAMVPIDVDAEYVSGPERRIFLTFPRIRVGRAFTVGVIKNTTDKNPVVEPYPDLSWHLKWRTCENIMDGFRVTIDRCNRLWIMDSGRFVGKNICPPKLFIFDLLTDTLIDKYYYPQDVHRNLSCIINPTLDIRDDDCNNTFAYLSDIAGNRIIVFDQARRESWRIENKYCYPFPTSGTYHVNGTKFEIMDGVLGKFLTPFNPADPNAERTLFFSAFSSKRMARVPTSIVRNQTIFASSSRAAPDNFTMYPGERPSQSGACAVDRNGVVFFGIHTDSSLSCWHYTKPFEKRNIHPVASDQTLLPFITGIKTVENPEGEEELWVLATNFHKVMTGTITDDIVNYRVFKADPKKLAKDTKCFPFKNKHELYRAMKKDLYSNDSV